MAKKWIESHLSSNIDDVIEYFKVVPTKITEKVNKEIPSIRKETKSMVKQHLTKGNGVDIGIYKNSIIVKNLTRKKDEIHFQVGANKPHHRLTHLLEHGHRMIPNKYFYRNVSKTKAIPHIKQGQDYADKAVENLYWKAIDLALKEGE